MFPRILPDQEIHRAVALALAEDLGGGDVTSCALVDAAGIASAAVYAEAAGVVAGIDLVQGVFQSTDDNLRFNPAVSDGEQVGPEATICTIEGTTREILARERVALNFLQHLSGIATMTFQFCELVKTYPVQIAATRKTTPGLRYLEKWAVTIGGGIPHRQNLSDGVLIKDNHLVTCGGDVAFACRRARANVDDGLLIEVEIESLSQLQAALDGDADIVLLDNMTVADVARAVELAKGKVIIEVSGGITVENIVEYAAVGPNIISIGALTHSAPALPMSLDLVGQ